MRVLVTRPEEDASTLVAALAARGHEALVEPMLRVAPAPGVAPPLDLDGVQALLFTSANGVRAFARLAERRDLPVFTVGDASAEAARGLGFAAVISAGGKVDDLARLAIDRLDPADGALYQAAASRLAGDLKGALEAAGFTLRREVLYETVPVTDLSASLRLELTTGQVAAATFFSPRTAETFAGLVGELGLSGSCAGTTALCLSEAVAEKLRGLDWRAVLVAERPNQDSLLARLDEFAGVAQTPAPESSDMTPGQKVITRFGGIRPMAAKLGVAVSTVQGWRERGAIPARHHERVLEAARTEGLEIGPAELGGATPVPAATKPAAAKPAKPVPAAATRPAPPPEPKPDPEPKPEPEPGPAPKSEPKPTPKIAQRSQPRPEPSTPPPRAQSEAVTRPGGGRRLAAALFGALLVMVGAGAALVARDLWMPLVDSEYGRRDDAAVLALVERVAELESAVAAEPAAAPPGLGPEALTPLADSLAALDGRVAALADSLAALEDRVAALAQSAPDAAGLAESEARVAALGERLERLERLGAEMPDGAAVAELAQRAEELAARIEDVAARPDPAPEISTLTQRVAELAAARHETEATATADAALSLAVLQLRAALQGSGPFAAELGLLRDLAASGTLAEGPELTALIAPLAGHAEAGIPSPAALDAEFPAAARAALIAARGGSGDGWWAGVVRRLSELVILRPVGRVEGAGTGAVLARAETWIRADDLPAALDELAALEGPAAEALAEWRAAAGARAAARQALAGLGGLLVARLRAAGG
jgi:uroporphyrinogen-III synthase